ncbi:MAG: undecaprenyl-diphosphate phosphatase [Endomicrobia bacterium]|nr:undecaprenyl-diphosphate phosphatase [Endomicrobiia bacterium]
MEYQVLLLAVIQGITEFLPISSSGHLVLLQSIFGLKEMLLYDILLHFATLLSIVVLFFNEIIKYVKNLKIILLILVLTIPTGIIGLLVKKNFSFVFDSGILSSITIFITGLWLYICERVYYEKYDKDYKKNVVELNFFQIITVGIAQGVAVIPGISRSGAMLGALMLLNIERTQAVKFTFVASIPAVLSATILEIREVIVLQSYKFTEFFIYGMLLAFFIGILSLKFLLQIVNTKQLKYFSFYCWTISVISFLYFLIK